NVLGQDMEAAQAFSQENPNAYLHFYGKLEAKHNRKMGHVTVLAEDLDKVREF
ncbi:MAG: 5-(carboxyamino)imidazole ribonucleotide synthase, partial [Streptococcus suis]